MLADDRLFTVDTMTGALREWQPGMTSGTVTAIHGSGDVVLIGGSLLQIGGQSGSLLALDASTAEVIAWDDAPPWSVDAIVPLGDGLAIVAAGEVYLVDSPTRP